MSHYVHVLKEVALKTW